MMVPDTTVDNKHPIRRFVSNAKQRCRCPEYLVGAQVTLSFLDVQRYSTAAEAKLFGMQARE